MAEEHGNDRGSGPSPAGETEPAAAPAGRSAADRPAGLGQSRVGRLWASLVLAAIILVLLLIFVLQNGQLVQVSFLGVQGQVPLGVALLLAAVGGVLIVAVPGSVRILQLRRTARRQRR